MASAGARISGTEIACFQCFETILFAANWKINQDVLSINLLNKSHKWLTIEFSNLSLAQVSLRTTKC